MGAQSASTLHSTHVWAAGPAGSPQTPSLEPARHWPGVFGVTAELDGTPDAQASSVQTLPSSGMSKSASIDLVFPAPSQTTSLQSPDFCSCADASFPSLTKA